MYFSDEIADRMSGSSEYSPSCSKIGIGGRIFLYFLYVFFYRKDNGCSGLIRTSIVPSWNIFNFGQSFNNKI